MPHTAATSTSPTPSAPPVAGADTSVYCPSCLAENAPESRYCKLCGGSITSNKAPVVLDATHNSISEEIDSRRARQLLDRALNLAERNDLPAAVLACRQAVALAPNSVDGHSRLGMLLDRAGDTIHAIQAYERVLQLAPGSLLEREALMRLREAQLKAGGAPSLDGAALQGDEGADSNRAENVALPVVVAPAATAVVLTEPEVTASAAQPAVVAAPEAPAADSGDVVEILPAISAADVTAVPEVTERRNAGGDGSRVRERRGTDRRNAQVPVAVERRRSSERRSARTTPPVGTVSRASGTTAGGVDSVFVPTTPGAASRAGFTAPTPHAASPFIGAEDAVGNRRPTPWQLLRTNPPHYWRGLPLLGATGLSLLFLGWAGTVAAGRNVPPGAVVVTPAPAGTTEVLPDGRPVDPATSNQPVANPNVVVQNQPGRPVTSPQAQPQGNTFPITTRNPTPAPGTRIAAAPRPAGSPGLPAPADRRPGPRFPPIQVPPASVNNLAPVRSTGGATSSSTPPRSGNSGGGGGLGLGPMPSVRMDNPAPPVTFSPVLPPGGDSGGNSSGGGPVNPASAPPNGYIRVTQGRIPAVAAPSRPAAAARNDESRAAASARGGQTDAAINRLTTAIANSDSGDVGFRYQQRATLFLERGDYSRAADDFQSAISSYNDQIARGEDLPSARAGLRTARSGLNVALSNLRR